MARVLAGRTFAGRPRGHLPALVCQSGARVENWRLHIQTAEAVYRPAAAVYRSAAEKGVQAVFVFTRLDLDARMSWVDAPHRPYDARHAHGAGTLMHRSSVYLKSCEVGFCRTPSRPDESCRARLSRRRACGLSLATPSRHWTTGRFASR